MIDTENKSLLVLRICSGEDCWDATEIAQAIEWLLHHIAYLHRQLADWEIQKPPHVQSYTQRYVLDRSGKLKSPAEFVAEHKTELAKSQAQLQVLEQNLELKKYLVQFVRRNDFFEESGTTHVMASCHERAIARVDGGFAAKESPGDWDSVRLMKELFR